MNPLATAATLALSLAALSPAFSQEVLPKDLLAQLEAIRAQPAQQRVGAEIQKGMDFLDAHRAATATNFDLGNAEKLAVELDGFGTDESLPLTTRGHALLAAAGVHGVIANKVRQNGGAAHGKKALAEIKEVLGWRVCDKEAAMAFGIAMDSLIGQSLGDRILIEIGLQIRIKKQSKLAMSAMESAGLASDPIYARLKKFTD